MAFLDKTQEILGRLDLLNTEAKSAQGVLLALNATASTVVKNLAGHSTAIASTEQQVSAAAGRLVAVGESASQTSADQAKRMSGHASEIVRAAADAEAGVSKHASNIDRRMEELKDTGVTRLDDLRARLADSTNVWDDSIKALIDSVELGVEPLTKLLDLYGDAMVDGERLRTFLGNLQLDTYSRRVTDFIDHLRHGAVDFDQLQKFLAKSNLEIGNQLLKAIDLFKQGKVTLEFIKKLVLDIERLFPDSQFSDLAEAVLHGLRDGSLK